MITQIPTDPQHFVNFIAERLAKVQDATEISVTDPAFVAACILRASYPIDYSKTNSIEDKADRAQARNILKKVQGEAIGYLVAVANLRQLPGKYLTEDAAVCCRLMAKGYEHASWPPPADYIETMLEPDKGIVRNAQGIIHSLDALRIELPLTEPNGKKRKSSRTQNANQAAADPYAYLNQRDEYILKELKNLSGQQVADKIDDMIEKKARLTGPNGEEILCEHWGNIKKGGVNKVRRVARAVPTGS